MAVGIFALNATNGRFSQIIVASGVAHRYRVTNNGPHDAEVTDAGGGAVQTLRVGCSMDYSAANGINVRFNGPQPAPAGSVLSGTFDDLGP